VKLLLPLLVAGAIAVIPAAPMGVGAGVQAGHEVYKVAKIVPQQGQMAGGKARVSIGKLRVECMNLGWCQEAGAGQRAGGPPVEFSS
jgi:hypothetical protein